jgi:hypothetical protein
VGPEDATRISGAAIGALLLLMTLHREHRRFAFGFATTTHRDLYAITMCACRHSE